MKCSECAKLQKKIEELDRAIRAEVDVETVQGRMIIGVLNTLLHDK